MTPYRLGHLARQMLTAISKTPMGLSADAIKALHLYSDGRTHNRTLKSLAKAGLITYIDDIDVWRITRLGKNLLKAPEKNAAASAKYIGTKAQPRRTIGQGQYTGQELTRSPTRPGSEDAYRIPSLLSGQRVATKTAMRVQGGAA